MATALADLTRLNDQNLVCLADSGTGHGVKPVGKRGENIPGPGRLACSLNSFSVAPGRAYSNLARMVSWNRWASWEPRRLSHAVTPAWHHARYGRRSAPYPIPGRTSAGRSTPVRLATPRPRPDT